MLVRYERRVYPEFDKKNILSTSEYYTTWPQSDA
jgi:hypothetical protein